MVEAPYGELQWCDLKYTTLYTDYYLMINEFRLCNIEADRGQTEEETYFISQNYISFNQNIP